ncbi:MAG: hypothetical protein O2894_06505 [Planctomycetota bacterium]|nr:hypothetical protein [Planctomycetota bacterium]
MRALLFVVAILVVGWAISQVAFDDRGRRPVLDTDVGEGPDPRVTATDERTYRPGTMPRSTMLVVTVTSASGHVPAGARAGYIFGGRENLRAADARGQVTFTDAPLGEIEIVARAPGFERGAQRRYLNAGLRTDVIMALQLEEGFVPTDELPKDR